MTADRAMFSPTDIDDKEKLEQLKKQLAELNQKYSANLLAGNPALGAAVALQQRTILQQIQSIEDNRQQKAA